MSKRYVGSESSRFASTKVPALGELAMTEAGLFVGDGSTVGSALPVHAKIEPSGYNVIVCAGQSNMSGQATDYDAVHYDSPHPRVFQWGSNGPYANSIAIASEPLLMHDVAAGMGPALAFARWYADQLSPSRRVLLVPTAHSGTAFELDPVYTWKPGGNALSSPVNLYEFTIAQANAAMAAAGPNARFAGVLWLQGEFDSGVSQANYASDLDALIAGFRSRITGAANSWFVAGQMTPEGIDATPGRIPINAAHIDTARRNTRSAFAYGTRGNAPGTLHYNAAGQRAMGRAMFDAHILARANVTGVPPLDPPSITFAQTGTTLSVAWERPRGRVTDYTLQYRAGTTGPWTTVTRAVPNLDSSGTVITGLTLGTTYQARVLTTNEQGTSAGTVVTYRMVYAPNSVTGLTAGAASSSVQPLTWTSGATDGTHDPATAYLVEYKKTSDSTWTAYGTVTVAAASVNGLQANLSYDYRVTATNPAGAATAATVTASTSATSPLADSVSASMLFGYGTRKLRSGATKAIRVRRSSDNTETDIAFSGNDLDIAALLTFCGAGNGFITKFYDQSTNGRDVAAPAIAQQAQVVTSGVVVTANSKASSTWATSFYSTASTCLLASGTGFSLLAVVKAVAPTGNGTFVIEQNATSTQYLRVSPQTTTGNLGFNTISDNPAGSAAAGNGAAPSVANGTTNQFSVADSGSNNTRWVNGTQTESKAYTRLAVVPTVLAVGGLTSGAAYGTYFVGQLSEIAAFAGVLSTGDRQAGEANQKNYYATP